MKASLSQNGRVHSIYLVSVLLGSGLMGGHIRPSWNLWGLIMT